MSETTNTQDKAKRPVTKTELELRSHPQPDGTKAYRIAFQGQVRYAYGRNPYDALQQGCRDMGATAKTLGKLPNKEDLLGEVANLPAKELQEFLAKVNAMGKDKKAS